MSFLVIALLGGAAAAREASQQPKAAESVDRAPRFQAGRATAASLACVVALASLGSGVAQAQQQESPALARGVVLSHWLQYDGRQPVTSTDLAAIKAKGFDHVRIQFDPEQLGWSANLGDRMPARMERLDHAIDMVLSTGLTAVIDFHGEKPIQQAIEENEAARRAFVGFWHQAALRYRDRPETSVVFELLNEPAFYGLGGSTKWEALERRALAEIRAVDPERFVLFADNEADQTDPDDLEEPRDAVEDARVGYVFHLYSPHIFTHFGATWGEPAQSPYLLLERVVYPASGMAAVGFQAAPGGAHDRAVRLLREYAQQDWGPARIEALVARLAQWAESHHTRLFCTEFGVLRTRADPASRMAWLTDAREALERHRVPWTVFDYADIFGIATGIGNVVLYDDGAVVPGDPSDPKRRFDTAALAALGMSPPR